MITSSATKLTGESNHAVESKNDIREVIVLLLLDDTGLTKNKGLDPKNRKRKNKTS